jgi:hypothetical protein
MSKRDRASFESKIAKKFADLSPREKNFTARRAVALSEKSNTKMRIVGDLAIVGLFAVMRINDRAAKKREAAE